MMGLGFRGARILYSFIISTCMGLRCRFVLLVRHFRLAPDTYHTAWFVFLIVAFCTSTREEGRSGGGRVVRGERRREGEERKGEGRGQGEVVVFYGYCGEWRSTGGWPIANMRLIEHWMLERGQGVDDLVCGGKIWGGGNYRSCMRQQTFDPNGGTYAAILSGHSYKCITARMASRLQRALRNQESDILSIPTVRRKRYYGFYSLYSSFVCFIDFCLGPNANSPKV